MVYDGIILSIIIGFIRKGSLRGFGNLKFQYGWVFPILLAVEIIIFFFENSVSWIGYLSNTLFVAVYLIGLFFIWMNRKKHGFTLIMVGVFLNFLVMILNGGRMPVSAQAAQVLDPSYIESLKAGLYGKHTLLTSSTRLPFLGDIIGLSKPYPRQQIISIGDVIMNIGIFLFIQDFMIQNKSKKTLISKPVEGGDTHV